MTTATTIDPPREELAEVEPVVLPPLPAPARTPVFLPLAGTGERRRRRKRERTRRRQAVAVLVVRGGSLALAIVLILSVLVHAIRSSHGATRVAATPAVAPAADWSTALVVETDASGIASLAVLARSPDGKGGSVVLLPPSVMAELPGFGLENG